MVMQTALSATRSNPPQACGSPAWFRRRSLLSMVASILMALPAAPALAGPPSAIDRPHARAVEAFRHGRFAEAYGRFIELANAGHPHAARYALWMCENGLPLFGRDWDCAPHEVEDWSRVAALAPASISVVKQKAPRRGTPPPTRM
jgi:hypothetical protein